MKRTLLTAALLFVGTTLANSQDATGIKAFSKVDFVSGTQVILFEDFLDDAIGDFPDGWDTNVSAEVVTIEGKPGHWLMPTGGGVFTPMLTEPLPDYFTFEFDVLASSTFTAGTPLSTSFAEMPGATPLVSWHGANNRYTYTVNPTGIYNSDHRRDGNAEGGVQVLGEAFAGKNEGVAHVAAWRTKERMRVYVNDQKVWDIPRAMVPTGTYDRILFYLPGVDDANQYFITNIRLAVGAPDTRNRLLTEGRWTTHGILFDVNSDRIRGESYGALKEIAGVLNEDPALKVNIIGHTDSDGEETSNLDLSKRRAAAVKSVLAADFGVAADRMETDGRGESEPAESNDTAAGKANNRRVEFVKT